MGVLSLTTVLAQNGHRQAPGSSSSSKTPAGAAYTLSDGTTVTRTGETLTTSTSDYNVVQVTKGTYNLDNCTITKSGDYSSSYSGDDTSFYGTNSAVYASGASAIINMTDCKVTTNSKGSNAVFATNGATITIDGITIDNSKSVSRGLHCTGGGIINAKNVDITTRSETSSTVATDRGGGTVTVSGGTITAKGSKSSVLYSTGTIAVDGITGLSEKGPIATVEGANTIIIDNSNMTSQSDVRGILLHQSNSGDATGTKPVCTITNSTLTTSDSSAPLCFVTNVTATLTLTDVTLNVASNRLMSVEYYKRGSGSTGNLILQTTKDKWVYTGTVEADDVNNAAVTIGANVTWRGAVNTANTAVTAKVTVESGATWVLTGNSYVSTLTNNGTIITNGYTLTAANSSGNGTLAATEAQPLTVGAIGWTSLCPSVALDFSTISALSAYTAQFSGSTVSLTAVDQVPAGEAVIICGTAGTYSIPMLPTATLTAYNDLSGALTYVTATDNYAYYALAKVSDTQVGFARVATGTAIPAGKAYYRTATGSGARPYYIIGTATDLPPVGLDTPNDKSHYNLQGRKAEQANKGIVISEGRKYINITK